jgi:hypothetical protein
MTASRATLLEMMSQEGVLDIFASLLITLKLPSKGSTSRVSSSRRGLRRAR